MVAEAARKTPDTFQYRIAVLRENPCFRQTFDRFCGTEKRPGLRVNDHLNPPAGNFLTQDAITDSYHLDSTANELNRAGGLAQR